MRRTAVLREWRLRVRWSERARHQSAHIQRTTDGSRVRRSSRFIFLNTVDLIEDAVKKYSREYYRTQRSNEPNPLNIGSPSRARTYDLRIDMASVVKRAQVFLPFEAS